MSFDAGEIIARARLDPSQFNKDLDKLKADTKRFEDEGHQIGLTAEMKQSDLNRARQQFARFDQQLYQDAVQRQRSGRGILAGMFGKVVGGAAGATLFGGLVGAGGAATSAGTEAAVRTEMNRLDQQLARDAATRARLSGLGGAGGAASGGGGRGGFFSSLLGGIGPNILGLGTKLTAGIGLGGSLLGALPALTGGLGALGIGGVGLGAAGILFKGANQQISPLLQLQNQIQQGQLTAATPQQRKALAQQQASLNQAVSQLPAAQRAMFQAESQISNSWQSLTQSFAPVLAKGLGAAAQIFKGLLPLLHQFFAASTTLIGPVIKGFGDLARTVLPLLAQGFRLAAPLMKPFLDGLSQLLGGVLRGLIPLLASVRPAVTVLAQILGMLGRDLGQMFKDFAPVVKASSVILKGLLSVLAAIFPIIGQLAAIFAKTLAPVFIVFAGVIKSLLPVLVLVGKIFSDLAAAIIGDLAAAFGALAKLLKDIGPSLNILAKALGQVFQILENSGVFAVFGNALEKMVPSLAKLINALVRGIAPVLPLIIELFAQLVTILAAGTAAAIGAVANALADLINAIPPTLLHAIVIGLAAMWAGFKGYTILKAANAAVKLFGEESLISSVKAAASWVVATATIVASFVAQAAAATAAFIAENVATLGIIAGIGLLIGAAIFLAKHWGQVWNDVKNWARDAWNFLTHGWGQFLIPGLTAIRYAVSFLSDHWSQIWGTITNTAQNAWNFLQNNIWQPLKNVLLNDIPNWWGDAVSAIGNAWSKIENVVKTPVAWVIDHVIDGLISAFDWISGKVGGPHIAPIHPFGLAEGGKLPGYGGGDRHLALLESGEAVVSKETTAAHAGELRRWGVPGMQGGGIIGGVTGFLSDIGHDIGSIFGGGGKILAALFSGNSVALMNAIKGILPHGVGGAVGLLGDLLTAIPSALIKDAVHFLVGLGGGGAGGTAPRGGGLGPQSLRMIEDWWIQAGGPGGIIAHIAAAITGAESGFRPSAIQQGQPYATTGWGLWQITPGNSEPQAGINYQLLNPVRNAIAAVAKYRGAGNSFSPWTTYMDGAYLRFMDTGGWLLPGVTAANNQTGMREAVLTPGQSQAFTALARYAEGNMSSGWGKHQIAEVINLMLPEGTTVAQAMTELVFRMKVAEQQGFAGVVP